jgi:hypothetical protein
MGVSSDAERLLRHGGNLAAARRLFPGAPEPWIDLSTGINARPYPLGEISAASWLRLPEENATATLEAAAGRAYGAPGSAVIAAAPGTQALIGLLPYLFPAKRVGILDFTYSEHELCWRQAGAQVEIVDSMHALAQCDHGVIVNPNNPDGRLVAPGALLAAWRIASSNSTVCAWGTHAPSSTLADWVHRSITARISLMAWLACDHIGRPPSLETPTAIRKTDNGVLSSCASMARNRACSSRRLP